MNALKKLHQKGIIHTDLHSGNVLINPTTLDVTIIDFGFGMQLPEGKATVMHSDWVSACVDSWKGFFAPEVASTGTVSAASDVWKAGVIIADLGYNKLANDMRNSNPADRPNIDHVLSAIDASEVIELLQDQTMILIILQKKFESKGCLDPLQQEIEKIKKKLNLAVKSINDAVKLAKNKGEVKKEIQTKLNDVINEISSSLNKDCVKRHSNVVGAFKNMIEKIRRKLSSIFKNANVFKTSQEQTMSFAYNALKEKHRQLIGTNPIKVGTERGNSPKGKKQLPAN